MVNTSCPPLRRSVPPDCPERLWVTVETEPDGKHIRNDESNGIGEVDSIFLILGYWFISRVLIGIQILHKTDYLSRLAFFSNQHYNFDILTRLWLDKMLINVQMITF